MGNLICWFFHTQPHKHLFSRFGLPRVLCLSVFAASLGFVTASAEPLHPLDLSARGALIDRILSERVETVLPGLMRRAGIDSWILVSREYNEDPVLKTFLPSRWFSARRRTILMIFDHGPDQPLETLAVARYPVGTQFKSAWDPESMPDQWQRVRQIIDERAPETIGINVSETFALADGLTKTDYDALAEALGPHVTKLKSAEPLAVGWLETRSQTEVELYPKIVGLAHDLIARAFSLEAITPGKTTTEELEWWLREAAERQNLDLWFHPSISKQSRRQNEATAQAGSTSGLPDVIQPGDLLHVDFGITYLRLNTDTQQHAYLLQEGETALPTELQVAFDQGNRLQDILMNQFKQDAQVIKYCWQVLRSCGPKASTARSTLIPWVITGMGQAQPLAFGISSVKFQARVTTRSTLAQLSQSSFPPPQRSKAGSKTSASCWRKMPTSTEIRSASSKEDRPHQF